MNVIPGSQAALIRYNMRQQQTMPTTQAPAIVVCGGGDPLDEYQRAVQLCHESGRPDYVTIVGNDMIADFPFPAEHACTLHPNKLEGWLAERQSHGYPPIRRIWSHRPFGAVTDYTADWQGSTGLIAIKIMRELGHTHVILCGVPMTVEGGHYKRQTDWAAAFTFRRGWLGRVLELKPYSRSFSGWTRDQLGVPTIEWLTSDLVDENQYPAPTHGLKA